MKLPPIEELACFKASRLEYMEEWGFPYPATISRTNCVFFLQDFQPPPSSACGSSWHYIYFKAAFRQREERYLEKLNVFYRHKIRPRWPPSFQTDGGWEGCALAAWFTRPETYPASAQARDWLRGSGYFVAWSCFELKVVHWLDFLLCWLDYRKLSANWTSAFFFNKVPIVHTINS